MMPSQFKTWLAFGSGIGIEISGPRDSESLHATAVRVRPTGARVIGKLEIDNFTHQPAGMWGTEFSNFARRAGMRHVGATVILPRHEVIVRQLLLPGVSAKDLDSAIGFQLDGLHPYPEDDVTASWSRLGSSDTVLIAITRRAVIDRYATLFAEAGIKIACFTCSAAVIYSALRLFDAAPAAQILAADVALSHIEIYGESPTRPLFSASFDSNANSALERAAALARSELRIDQESAADPISFEDLLRAAPALPYAAALASACPRLGLAVNLLPQSQRQASSRALLIPSVVAGAIVLVLAVALAAFPGYENRKYIRSLEAEIAKVQPLAKRAEAIDRKADATRKKVQQLDDFRRRAKSDMDVLQEMTRVLPPSTWLNLLEVNRSQIYLAGETDQAAPLLKTIDASPLFEASEFAMPPIRTTAGEVFRIRTNREAGK
jgi:Tfp pilus assembly protein PilN